MHIHIYVKLGFWQRLGIVLLFVSAAALAFYVTCRVPTQVDVFPCIIQLESINSATAEHQETLKKCYAEIAKSAIEVQQLSFIVKSVLIWIWIVFSVYALSSIVSWIRTGGKK